MVDSSGNLHFLTKISFPPYCVATVDGNVAIVAGGGGISKTGVKNKFVSHFIVTILLIS